MWLSLKARGGKVLSGHRVIGEDPIRPYLLLKNPSLLETGKEDFLRSCFFLFHSPMNRMPLWVAWTSCEQIDWNMGPTLKHEILYTNNIFIDMMSSCSYSLRRYPPQKNLFHLITQRQATLTSFTLQGSTSQSCPLEWIGELLKITWCLSTPNQLTHSLWSLMSQHKHVLGALGYHCVFSIEDHCAGKTISPLSIYFQFSQAQHFIHSHV